ncbi:MAG TPA: DoxX family membrane protein [Kofleriaceae bacterium]|nr:DoxX family membrane protein [Kofleriaceae bacterium]
MAFRFGVVFAAILVLPFPLDLVPKSSWLADKYGDLWSWGAHRFGDLIGIDVPPTQPTGSGDTTEGFTLTLLAIVLALIGAAVWTAIDRKRVAYPRVAAVTRIALRYWLGYTMLSYGFAKVFKSQFPYPPPVRLEQPLGEMSPMGLLWTFMGYSLPYNLFTGAAECFGGALLLFRRTTTLGALVLIAVLANVVTLNFCYDVPVKLYSSELLLVAIVLLWPDLGRLASVIFGFAAPATSDERWALSRRSRRAAIVVKLLVLVSVVYHQLAQGFEYQSAIAQFTTPLEGRYDVVSAPAELHLKRVATGFGALFVWTTEGGEPTPFQATFAAPHSVTLAGQTGQAALTYAKAGPIVILDGTWNQRPIHVVLHEREPALLDTRGFHWIAEYPFNR